MIPINLTRKITLILIKYIPVIQMTGIFVTRLLNYYFDSFIIKILDFIFADTLLLTILLISCSRTFKFCVYHRVIIVCNIFIQLMYEINEITEIILLIFQFITYNVLLIYYIKHKAKF